jgi:hypothetical protein
MKKNGRQREAKQMKKENKAAWTLLFMLVLASLLFFSKVMAEPEGASVTYVSNTTKVSAGADNRTDNKGTITTVTLSTTQQNIKWKAYVGNVSGILVLKDADSYSLYEWPSAGSPDGKVYMTMNSSVDWSTIQCANETNILTQQTALGHLGTAVDNINNTFSTRIHENFDVGTIPITNSTCKSAFPWVNNTAQAASEEALFQEVLLMDTNLRIIFTALIDQNTKGFRDDAENTTYDFQALVPDFTTSTTATYYFYVEISG